MTQTLKTELRRQLAELRDVAMELAANLEFNIRGDVTENPVWQLATETIRKAESAMKNSVGELDND